VATHLIDKSAWARLVHDEVALVWATPVATGRIAVTGVGMLEILVSSTSGADFIEARFELSMMPRVAVTEQIIDRALDVQGLMAARGTHRAPSPVDLVLAACAEANGLAVLHYDKGFDLIAEVTGQPMDWVALPGSVA